MEIHEQEILVKSVVDLLQREARKGQVHFVHNDVSDQVWRYVGEAAEHHVDLSTLATRVEDLVAQQGVASFLLDFGTAILSTITEKVPVKRPRPPSGVGPRPPQPAKVAKKANGEQTEFGARIEGKSYRRVW